MQANRCATERLAADQATLHVARVGEHQRRIANLQLRMPDPAIRAVQAEHLDRAERGFVEVDGLAGILDAQVRGDGVLSFGDWFDGHFMNPP
ncbi:hypothetical protein D3C72_2314040 [compost metagenome]